jgi:hypothetical protein
MGRCVALPRLRVGLLALAVLACPRFAAAQDDEATSAAHIASFEAARSALDRGAYTEAIDGLELLADQGFVHPDASYNRGIAYLGRARSPGALAGDRGRAAAGFREALLLRPEDEAARARLERVREEIAKQRARLRREPRVVPPSVSRALVGLFPENMWAVLALVSSVATTLGLTLHRLARRSTRPSAGASRLVGAIVAAVSGLALLLAGSAAAVARQLREETALAVVVVPEARVLDERGRALGEAPYAEGTEIYVRAADGDLVRVEEASRDVWLRRSDIRTLTPPALGHSTRRNTADLKTTANPKSTADPKTR